MSENGTSSAVASYGNVTTTSCDLPVSSLRITFFFKTREGKGEGAGKGVALVFCSLRCSLVDLPRLGVQLHSSNCYG